MVGVVGFEPTTRVPHRSAAGRRFRAWPRASWATPLRDGYTAESGKGPRFGALLPPEREAVEGAVAKGVRESRAGRECGRQALVALGHAPVALPRLADRAPAWPDGVVGSISHCEGFCGAVVGWKARFAGLGLDVEQPHRVHRQLWPHFTTEAEREALGALPPERSDVRAAVVFSAKGPSTRPSTP